ncbi:MULTISPECIES: hypothetical protein [Clostridiaceae]|uniref:Uncharacterized protein n=1 Tax=Clostridium facile TaxID=2763035 RepID=A0ABR7IP74_9CLOT|nr:MULTISPECIES: hypothetical protein [Clostridiaceae]MBC5786923.1 hypothetical protein [Clostridium facile]PWM98832.1 MAG: hypothetical protein DBX37_05975 [Massilioclostridium sp.]
MAVTTMDELKHYAEGTEVELSGFAEGQPFVVKLKRPSLMLLAQNGDIPNTLMAAASELFNDGIKGLNPNNFSRMADIFTAMAKASMVSPTYQEVEEAGLSLTDIQLLQIYNFSQTGVAPLQRFHQK